ncbi:hypothetical protein DH86_00004128, partial [Scytalidium sp. 3C]
NGRSTGNPTLTHHGGRTRADEEQPLLGRKPAAPSVVTRFRNSLMSDVRRDWADVVLLFCYLITGLLDSSSISMWGSFVSMQTGNTVYLGLGLAAPRESTRWIKSGTSLGCFCIGSFLFSRFHRLFSQRRRWVICVSFATQMALTLGAAIIVTIQPPPRDSQELSWSVLVPIALVALQACGQAVCSRALKYNALTSVVLTSIYCDLFSDADLFAVQNVERNRRLAAPLLLLLGAILGGLFAHSSAGFAGALWTAAFLKFVIVLTWVFWPAEHETDD